MTATTTAASWAAIATVDLATTSAPAFAEAVGKIEAKAKELREAGKLPAFPVTTGKMRITPEDAEKALLHNGGNRKIRLGHVQEIASQMQNGGWRLAQPLLFDENGDLIDGQHRLFAILFGGFTVETMAMVVPVQPGLFAVVDSGRGRSASDALFTAGMNGVASATAAAAKLLYRYEHGQLGVFKQPKTLKLANVEVLNYVKLHPEISDTAHEVLDDHPTAVSVVGDKGASVAFGYLVNQHYEDGVLTDFYNALGVDGGLAADHPISALHHRLEQAGVSEEKLSNPRKLALLIKAFILDASGEKVGKKGIFIRDNEKFPRIEDAAEADKAA